MRPTAPYAVPHTVPPEASGSRLDFFVAALLGVGLRAAKRLAEEARVTVDGRARPAHYKLSAGMCVTIDVPPPSSPDVLNGVRLLAATTQYVFFHKPAGLHTAHLAGGLTPSLEEYIRTAWADMAVMPPLSPSPVQERLTALVGGQTRMDEPLPSSLPALPPSLLSRLDALTSGIVVAACTEAAARHFRELEARGNVTKRYFAVVHGVLPDPMTIRNALNMDGRKKTQVLAALSDDATRYTVVTPAGPAASFFPNLPGKTTLAVVTIQRGARHQIRAHLAAAGFPLLGDTLYGGEGDGALHLHHAYIMLPGVSLFCPPAWEAR